MLLLVLSVIGLAAASCPQGYILEPNTDKCYRVSTLQSSFFAAQYGCTEDGANLASITNAFENSFVGQLLPPFGYYFIGLTRLVDPNKWSWLDETPLYYTNFYPNQDFNESCVAYNSINDACTVSCSGNLGYVCSVTASSSCPTCPTCNGTCAARCESGWAYFPQTHSCYRTLKDGNWFTAEEDCQVAGAHLTSIHSQEENDFVMQISKTGKEGSDAVMPYIGLRRLMNNTWIWSDGTAVNYTHWHPYRPRDTPYDCAYVFSDLYSGGSDWYSDWESCVCTDVHRAFVSGGVIFATVVVDVLPHVQWLYGTHYNRSRTLPLTYVLICVGFVVSFLLAEIGRRLAGYVDSREKDLDDIQRLKRQTKLAKRKNINTLVALATFSVALGVHSEIRHFELLTTSSHRITVILFGTLLRQLVALIPFLRVTDPIRQALLSIIMGLLVFILHMIVVYVTVIHLEKLPDYKQTTYQIVFESTSAGVLLYISLIELMAKQKRDRRLFLQLGVFILTLGGMILLHVFLRGHHRQ